MKASIFFLALSMLAVLAAPVASQSFSLREAPDVTTQPLSSEFMQSLDTSTQSDGTKSAGKAFLYSLLLPGSGHQYVGYKGTATGFYIAEAAIWTSFVAFLVQENNRTEGFKDYASSFAHVSGGHSDEYYEIIGEYSSSAQYESEIKQQGRIDLFPDVNTQGLDDYFADNRVADFEPWLWSGEDERFLYRNKRFSSKRAERRAVYALWMAAANRVVSAVFAVKAARDHNSRLEQAFHFEFGPPRYHPEDELQTGVSIVGRF